MSKYVNTNHFISCATIVECLWSKFDASVSQHCEKMSPMLIEAILFLKEKRDVWSLTEISEALCRVKTNEVHVHIQKEIETQAAEQAQIAVEAFVENISVTLAPINNYRN